MLHTTFFGTERLSQFHNKIHMFRGVVPQHQPNYQSVQDATFRLNRTFAHTQA